MGALIRFFTKILDICKLVPMLPVVVIAAIPLALLGDCVRGAMRWRFRYLAIRASASGWLSHWC